MSLEFLKKLGWSSFFEQSLRDYKGYEAGRVAAEHKGFYTVWTPEGEWISKTAGKMLYDAADRRDLPAVGDWVAVKPRSGEGTATIYGVLQRRSCFLRTAAGGREAQVVAANIDVVFLVTSLNMDFNPRRLERYLAAAWESGAAPVIVLSKADLCRQPERMFEEAVKVACGVPVHIVSVPERRGIDELREYMVEGKTIAVLGSSGVGKSTLINYFLGTGLQRTAKIREHDDRGRHTTTTRELILLPDGGLVLDTPGMRELQLWESEAGLEVAFEDVQSIAAECHFSDCSHVAEPGCAVRQALAEGRLSEERFSSYEKLQKELQHNELKQDRLSSLRNKKRWKLLSKEAAKSSVFKRESDW